MISGAAMPRQHKKYEVPDFLRGRLDQGAYEKWLRNKAVAHAKRDRTRFGQKLKPQWYRDEIHAAVIASRGFDQYTGERLDWEKVSTYSNKESKSGKSKYKSTLSLLPTVDHVHLEDGTFRFCICGWRVNDAKSDMTIADFLSLCTAVLRNHGYSVSTQQ
jgi:hypothetical protein